MAIYNPQVFEGGWTDEEVAIMATSDNIVQLFDEDGNCPTLGDPFRDTPLSRAATVLFDEDGYLTEEAICAVTVIIRTYKIHPLCDAVRMLVADYFAHSTDGCYPTTYLWR